MFSLNNSDKKNLDNTWEFIKYFSNPFGKIKSFGDTNWMVRNGVIFGPYLYRDYIVNTIRNKYTYQDFYKYEKIVNKLFWNLKRKLKPFVKDNKTKYKIENNINDKTILINSIPVGRSFTNSYIQYNEKNNKWYVLEKISKLDLI